MCNQKDSAGLWYNSEMALPCATPNLPAKCEISHSSMPLTARKARVILHHNEIRDCIGDMASQMWPQVIKEPVVNEAASVISGDPELTLDLAIRGP